MMSIGDIRAEDAGPATDAAAVADRETKIVDFAQVVAPAAVIRNATTTPAFLHVGTNRFVCMAVLLPIVARILLAGRRGVNQPDVLPTSP